MSTPYPPPQPTELPPGLFDDSSLPGATLPQAVRRFFDRYTVFSGRASRSEYWWVLLFHFLVYIATLVLAGVAAGIGEAIKPAASTPPGAVPGPAVGLMVVGALGGLYLLLVLIPMLALRTRRLHDAGYSGWFQLLLLVPVAELVVLIFTLLPSSPDGRRYDRAVPIPGYGEWSTPA